MSATCDRARAPVAEQWHFRLGGVIIESEVRIKNAAVARRSSTMPYVNAAIVYELFAYSVWVPTADRKTAVVTLREAGWDGNSGQRNNTRSQPGSRYARRYFALAAGAALIILRLART